MLEINTSNDVIEIPFFIEETKEMLGLELSLTNEADFSLIPGIPAYIKDPFLPMKIEAEEFLGKAWHQALYNDIGSVFTSGFTGLQHWLKTRLAYCEAVDGIKVTYDYFNEDGIITEEEARNLHALRRNIAYHFKEESGSIGKIYVGQRNLKLYGDVLGPDFDSLLAKGKSYQQIAQSSYRSGGGDIWLDKATIAWLYSYLG